MKHHTGLGGMQEVVWTNNPSLLCSSTATSIQELAGELSSVYTERSPKDTVKVVLIRIVTNTFVLVTLVAGAIAVFYAVDAVS